MSYDDDAPIHNLALGQGLEGLLRSAKLVRAKTKFPDKIIADGKSYRTILTGTWDGLGEATLFVSAQVAQFGRRDNIFGGPEPWEGGVVGTGVLPLLAPETRVRIELVTRDGKMFYNLRQLGGTPHPDPDGARLAHLKAEYDAAKAKQDARLAAADAQSAKGATPTTAPAAAGRAPVKASPSSSKPSTVKTADYADFPKALSGEAGDEPLPF